MPRLLVTADLHYNHSASRPSAETLIDQLNAAARPGDGVLFVGDAAAADGDDLERCLARFRVDGPRLFVAGNHELWTRGPDSHALFEREMPDRVRAAGWHWLEGDPFVLPGGVAVVGTIGWYDYSFALPMLGIPRRFYERKVSPAVARRSPALASLFERTDDLSPEGSAVVARWNDGRFVKLHRPDEQFLTERLATLSADLDRLQARADVTAIVAASHHVPFEALMPPKPEVPTGQAFAGAFLGSPAIGQVLLRYPKVRRVYCGHSHVPAEATVGHVHAVNLGCGHRWKRFETLDLESV